MNMINAFSIQMILRFVYFSISSALKCMDTHCDFEFVIKQERSMIYTEADGTTHNVQWNSTEGKFQIISNSFNPGNDPVGMFVAEDDVIQTDGYAKSIYVINEQFPGPTIEVMENAEVK